MRLAQPALLDHWRQTLMHAIDEYYRHLAEPDAEAQELAWQGLTLLRRRVQAIESHLNQS
jgi:hypothetical protein